MSHIQNVCMYIHTYTYTYTHIYIYMHIYIYISIYISICTYISIDTYVYLHLDIHTDIETSLLASRPPREARAASATRAEKPLWTCRPKGGAPLRVDEALL